MGNNNNTSEKLSNYSNYKFLEKISEISLGDFSLLEEISTKKIFALKEFCFQEKEEFIQKQKIIEKSMQLSHQNLINIVNYNKLSESILCSSVYKIFILTEYLTKSLEKELSSRIAKEHFFTENEIFCFIYDISSALSSLQNENVFHGAVKFSTIYLANNGKFKITEPRIFKNTPNYVIFNEKHRNNTESVFICPALLKNLKMKRIEKKVNSYKSDVFALGMIVLEMIFLKNLQEKIYDIINMEVNEKEIFYLLNNLPKNFSQEIRSLLESILEIDEMKRLDFIHLKDKLNLMKQNNVWKYNYIGISLIGEEICNEDDKISKNPTENHHKNKYSLDKENKRDIVNSNSKVRINYDSYNNEKNTVKNDILFTIENPIVSEIIKEFKSKQNNVSNNGKINKDYESLNEFNNFSLKSNENNAKKEVIHELYEDGSIYEGEKVSGLREGKGKFFYADGGKYEGEWLKGRMHGEGILYYPSGNKAYEGFWQNDKFFGRGIVYNETSNYNIDEFNYKNFNELDDFWVKYEGEFKNDNKDGFGTLFLSTGEKFVGKFIGDFVNGQGTFIKKDGVEIYAVWSNNNLICTSR